MPCLLLLCLAISGVLQALGQSTSGFISIDCGLPGETGYVEAGTLLSYSTDAGFIDAYAGSNQNVSLENIDSSSPNLWRNTLRSFPSGVRNCYTLGSLVAGLKYLIRAKFLYGNYDGLSRLPMFDLYIGFNFWTTVKIPSSVDWIYMEAIVVVPHDSVQVCLVNTGGGVPFISGLDLRPLENKLYPQANTTQGLVLLHRINFGGSDPIRYPADPYDRYWFPFQGSTTPPRAVISTGLNVRIDEYELHFQPPQEVMQTAMTTRNVKDSIEFTLSLPSSPGGEQSLGYIEMFYFAELQQFPNSTALREFDIYENGFPTWKAYTPKYLSQDYVAAIKPFQAIQYVISLNATARSTRPPIINAMELFAAIPTTASFCSGNSCKLHKVDSKRGINKRAIYIGVPVLVIVVLVVVAIQCFWLRRGRKQGPIKNSVEPTNDDDGNISLELEDRQFDDGNISLEPENRQFDDGNISLEPENHQFGDGNISLELENRQFTYMELEKITNNFQRQLGRGGFGYVFHGSLDNGTEVAVKLSSHSSDQDVKQFLAEAQVLTRIRHKNLVHMIGFCTDRQHMALVYEYMPQGTLQEHISGEGGTGKGLPWRQRLRVALESAQGLEYLHKGCSPPIIHRDVKTANILLNAKLEVKIADFGLSKAYNCEDDTHLTTNVFAGTHGYVDPEYMRTMQPSTKSDVYSFGVVLLELVTGKPAILRNPEPITLTHWARQRLAQGDIESVVDARMQGDHDINAIWKTTEIALKCTEGSPLQRPSMTDVVMQLQECLALEERCMGGDNGFYTGSGIDGMNQNMGYNLAQPR